MSLDVDTPAPPTLRDPQDVDEYDAVEEPDEPVGDDHRREELAQFLRDGAWERAFGEWADHTLLDESEFELVTELDLVEELDFYWNPAAGDVGYRAPTVPPRDSLPAPYDEQFRTGDLQSVESELEELARTVTEVLEADFVDADAGDYGFYADDEFDEE